MKGFGSREDNYKIHRVVQTALDREISKAEKEQNQTLVALECAQEKSSS